MATSKGSQNRLRPVFLTALEEAVHLAGACVSVNKQYDHVSGQESPDLSVLDELLCNAIDDCSTVMAELVVARRLLQAVRRGGG